MLNWRICFFFLFVLVLVFHFCICLVSLPFQLGCGNVCVPTWHLADKKHMCLGSKARIFTRVEQRSAPRPHAHAHAPSAYAFFWRRAEEFAWDVLSCL